MSRILIAYGSSHGQTRKIAEVIAGDLRRTGHIVELADAMVGRPPPVQDYDVVVLGARVQFGRHAQPIVDYIAANRAELDAIPSYFFSVSMSAAGAHGADPQGYLNALFTTARWQPREAIALGGGLPYRRYGFVLRLVMKALSARGGHPTDTSRDHDCTDWTQVHGFAARIAAELVVRRPPGATTHAQA